MTREVEYFNVTVFGESLTLASDEGAPAVEELVRRVDFLMQQTAHKMRHPDEKKVAILTALKLAREVASLEAVANFKQQHETKLINLIERELAMHS